MSQSSEASQILIYVDTGLLILDTWVDAKLAKKYKVKAGSFISDEDELYKVVYERRMRGFERKIELLEGLEGKEN